MLLIILIVALAVTVSGLVVQFVTSYYSQVRFIRRFFRNKGDAPDEYIKQTELTENINYESAFPSGTLDIYTSIYATEPQPIVLWVHGGGYVGGDKSCIKPWAHTMAAKLKVAVASMNYCLAPEQHYPTPIIQIGEAIRNLTTNSEKLNLDPTKIFIGGDSAGAQLCSQFAALVCNESLQKQMNITPPISKNELKGIMLCCGFYNMDTVMKSHFPAMKTFLWAYTNSKKIAEFAKKSQMSSINFVNSEFCDTFLTCGNADPFIGQAHEMADALRENNVSGTVYLPKPERKKLGHEYQFKIDTEEGNEALKKAVEFIEKRIR